MPARIILFELNEVPYRVLDDFVARNPNSTLAHLLPRCAQYNTVTEDRHLSPWVTWPSLHRGVFDAEHGIQHFGQDLTSADARYPPLWQILHAHGARVGVFASLHTYPLPAGAGDYAFYVPDPFAPGSETIPAQLGRFQRLNLKMSRQSPRNVSTAIPWREAAHFLAAAPRLGLRAATAWATLQQLRDERRKPSTRVRRRTFQTVLAFDLFEHQLRRMQPDFCTFFTNHVASAMHRYWAAAYPDDYAHMEFDAAWRATYREEIDYAMWWFDAFLSRLATHVDAHPGCELWVTSSMGQAATVAQPLETQLYITDLARFMAALGVGEGEWSQRPAMAPEVSLFVVEHRVDALRSALAQLRVGGQPFHFSERERGFFMISAGHPNLPAGVRDAHVGARAIPLQELGLENVPIEDHSTSSAYHVPEGHLLIYAPDRLRTTPAGRPRVRSIDIAPAILTALGVVPPPGMRGDAAVLAQRADVAAR